MRSVRVVSSEERGWQVIDAQTGQLLPVGMGTIQLNPTGVEFNMILSHKMQTELSGTAKLMVCDPSTGTFKDVVAIKFADGSVWTDAEIN